jgi:phosphoribosyl 1,2-cyclic phosphate phosphodiesterase
MIQSIDHDRAIKMAQQIGAKQTLLTHLSHEVDHPVHDQQLPDGINLAYDGQLFNLPMNLPAMK